MDGAVPGAGVLGVVQPCSTEVRHLSGLVSCADEQRGQHGGAVVERLGAAGAVATRDTSMMPLLVEGLSRASAQLGVGATPLPPSTLIGVAALAEPDLLVEVEATAVID